MAYNHGLEFKKFEARQRILRLQYEQLGMSEANIAALYQADLREFNSDRRHEEHRPENLEDYVPLATTEIEGHSRLWWVEEINDPVLARQLKSLSEADLKLLTLSVFDGFGQAEIAGQLGVSQAAVSKKLARLKKFLKFFLIRGYKKRVLTGYRVEAQIKPRAPGQLNSSV